MPMDECRECGQAVSIEAALCPHCGIRNPSELGRIERGPWRLKGLYGCVGALVATAAGFLVMVVLGLRDDFWGGLAGLAGIVVYAAIWTYGDRQLEAQRSAWSRKRERQSPPASGA